MNVAERVTGAAAGSPAIARCLGAFRIEDRSGNPLHVRTRKARALLALLSLNGRPITRDRLADMLWSDRGEVQARSSLRQAIFELQRLDPLGGPILAAGREDVSLVRGALVTDLELIRSAAAQGDWPRLQTLLESSDAGLLTDLDGLDSELDDWLRHQRAHEPGKALAAALDAAERCASEAGPRAALDLVSEILRLDPVNEEATRFAMRLAHELGDSVALHRHFAALGERLRDEYDAEPSPETVELYGRLANGRPAMAAGELESAASHPAAEPAQKRGSSRRFLPIAAALVVLAIAVAAFVLLTRDSGRQAAGQGTLLLAVLPFEEQPPGNRLLADGLEEQTRIALSRNPSLRLLGRATTNAMAEQRLSPRQYGGRFGVTHVLEGMVRRNGDEVVVSASLSRTSDGVAIWHDTFRGRMGEPFALQDAIASGIEGKLRGRLAPGGGRRAEQIATSPEVYALYSEARRLVASRERDNARRAEALLREAVKADPNYGPAWSLLGAAIYFNGRVAIADSRRLAEALAAARRALSLAPNFAPAHATLAMLEGAGSPSEAPLRRAVALDPSYSEAWNWLGNSLASQHRLPEALEAYERSVEIDPLFRPAIQNLAGVATELGNQAAVERLVRRVRNAGASRLLIDSIRAHQLFLKGDLSGAAEVLRDAGLDAQGRSPPDLWLAWFETLIALGHFEALQRITRCPEWYGPVLAGKALPPKMFEGRPVEPEEFWTSIFFSTPASRALANKGRESELVSIYRRAFRNSDDFVTRTTQLNLLAELAPTLALALRSTGEEDEASYLLAAASNQLEQGIRRSSGRQPKAQLAMVRAAQGERAEAVALLESALRQGWLPDGRSVALDLAQEPAFRALRGDSRFEALRKRILGHIAKERAELGPLRA